MSNKTLGIVGIIIAFVVVGAFGAWKFTSGKNTATSPTSTQQSLTPTDKFTVSDVAKHNTESDCWTIISGNVYDITSYIPYHPGGAEILRACGTDGTTLFNTRHTTDGQAVGSGTPHSENAQAQLATLQVGVLVTN